MTASLTHRILPARTGTSPHPGLLLLHGRGADENDLLPLAAELDPRLFVVSARAPYSFPWGGGAMWYELDAGGVGYPEQGSLQISLDLLRSLIDDLPEQYGIDPARLFTAGFSMGAVMAGTAALLWPERVAGAAMLSGYLPLHNDLPFKPEEAAGRPVFQAHGTLDQVIPVRFGREARDYLQGTAVDLTYREYPMGHEISMPELGDLAGWMSAALDQVTTAA